MASSSSSKMLFPTAAAADENAITYEIFFAADAFTAPAVSASDDAATTSRNSDQSDEQRQRAAAMRTRDDMLAFARTFTRDFIWQCEQFHLTLAEIDSELTNACGTTRFYLHGRTRVGDAIQDEWVITALLVALTKQYPLAVARARDSDGEFLLIECADALPEWVHPENSAGRVLLCNGALHLVPPSVVAEDLEATAQAARRRRQQQGQATANGPNENNPLDLFAGDSAVTAQRCLRAVIVQPATTRANASMQHALQLRLADVPLAMETNRHCVQCLLSRHAAHVLALRPDVLGAAVEAFYYRDPTRAAAVCARMRVFRVGSDESRPVTRAVAFSRCMFAQLKRQQFAMPRPFCSVVEYSKALDVPNDPTNDPTNDQKKDPTAQLAAEIGMKLTCGLELLYAADTLDQFGASWCAVIDDALANVDHSDDVNDPALLAPNDDDAWLYVHPDSLEATLRHVDKVATTNSDAAPTSLDDASGADALTGIASMFHSFLDGVSSVDGVESQAPVTFDPAALFDILNSNSNDPSGSLPVDPNGGDAYFYDDDDDDSDGSDSNDDSDDDDDARLAAAMAEMDAELATSHVGKSFARVSRDANDAVDDTTDDTATTTSDQPLDLDFNLLANLLESFASQDGHAGPVSNILGDLAFPRAS